MSAKVIAALTIVLICGGVATGFWLWTPDRDRATLEAKYASSPNDFVNVLGVRSKAVLAVIPVDVYLGAPWHQACGFPVTASSDVFRHSSPTGARMLLSILSASCVSFA